MNWFELTCRRVGLTLHHVVQPLKPAHRQVVSRRVEERRVDQNVTFRRTTIEEVELRQGPQSTQANGELTH